MATAQKENEQLSDKLEESISEHTKLTAQLTSVSGKNDPAKVEPDVQQSGANDQIDQSVIKMAAKLKQRNLEIQLANLEQYNKILEAEISTQKLEYQDMQTQIFQSESQSDQLKVENESLQQKVAVIDQLIQQNKFMERDIINLLEDNRRLKGQRKTVFSDSMQDIME
jgi:hypothetical protein